MEMKEIIDLISIRNYIQATINGSNSIDRKTVSELSGILILADKKILDIILDKEFKSYIKFENVTQAIKSVVKLNNIKSGMTTTNLI